MYRWRIKYWLGSIITECAVSTTVDEEISALAEFYKRRGKLRVICVEKKS